MPKVKRRKRELVPRKKPPLTTLLASALCSLVRVDEHGTVVPLLDRAAMKQLTPKQIIAQFQFQHEELHAITRNDHPTNITPMLVAAHRKVTAERDVPDFYKGERLAITTDVHQGVMLAKAGVGDIVEAKAQVEAVRARRGRKLVSGNKLPTGRKLRSNPKIPSRGFQKDPSKPAKRERFTLP